MSEYLDKLLSSSWLYVLILLILIVFVALCIRINRKKQLEHRVTNGQLKVNEISSHSFTVEIAQTEALARINKTLKDTTIQAKKDYDTIQSSVNNISTILQDASELIAVGKFKDADNKLNEVDGLLNETEQLTKKLEGVLKTVLSQSVIQRKRINELKDEFHQIKNRVNAKPAEYTFCWEALDRLTQMISHKFSNFETIMEAGKYEEAATLSNEIAGDLKELNIKVQKLPDLIKLAKDELPTIVERIKSAYNVLSKQGTYLYHLNIDASIENINGMLAENLKHLKQCESEIVEEKLIDCETSINQLSANLEVERNAFRDLLNLEKQTQDLLTDSESLIKKINECEADGFVRYGLNDLNRTFNDYQEKYKEDLEGYNSLMEVCNSNSIPASTMIVTFKSLYNDVLDAHSKFKSISNLLVGNKNSEAKVKDLISRFVVVLNEAKASIKLSKLPSISSQYDQDIEKAEKIVATISSDLMNDTVDVEKMNKNVDDAQKLIVTLYHNVNNLTDTAKDVEDFIILCNKYRPYYPDIDSALYSAELAFRNGEYTKACKIVCNSLETVDSDLAESLMKKINEKVKLQKDAK